MSEKISLDSSDIKYIILIFYIKDRSIGFHLLIKISRTGIPLMRLN